jgi:hypothetical protein
MKVKSLLAVTLLFLPLFASAALPAAARDERERVSAPERRVEVTKRARNVATDRMGNNWIFHGVAEIPRETEAAAVTLLRPDGSLRTFFASDLLPAGTIYPGKVGQVFSISPMTTPGYYAATVGYISKEHYTRNAVVAFALGTDGEPQTMRVIQIRNAATVIGGPRDTMVVTAADPLGDTNFALATVFDIDGNVHAELIPFGAATLTDAAAVTRQVRLQQSGIDDFALYDPQSQLVQHYSVGGIGTLPSLANATAAPEMRQPRRAAYPEIALTADWAIDIEDAGIAAKEVKTGRFLGLQVDNARQTVTVARGVLIDGAPRAVVNRYDGRNVETWVADGPWNAVLWNREAVTGFAPRGVLVEQRVSLKDRIELASAEKAAPVRVQQRSGCSGWMTARQCAQLSAPELPLGDLRKLRSIGALDGGGGEGCFDSGNMCAHSVSDCMDFWTECDLDDQGNTYWMNCTLDYCVYDACQEWSCSQSTYKICCPERPPVTTTYTNNC